MTISVFTPHVSVGGKPIFNELTAYVPAGEVHVVMGANGADRVGLCYAGDWRPS